MVFIRSTDFDKTLKLLYIFFKHNIFTIWPISLKFSDIVHVLVTGYSFNMFRVSTLSLSSWRCSWIDYSLFSVLTRLIVFSEGSVGVSRIIREDIYSRYLILLIYTVQGVYERIYTQGTLSYWYILYRVYMRGYILKVPYPTDILYRVYMRGYILKVPYPTNIYCTGCIWEDIYSRYLILLIYIEQGVYERIYIQGTLSYWYILYRGCIWEDIYSRYLILLIYIVQGVYVYCLQGVYVYCVQGVR